MVLTTPEIKFNQVLLLFLLLLFHAEGARSYSSEPSQVRQELRDAEGRLMSPLLDGPLLDDLGTLAPGFLAELQARAAPARAGRLYSARWCGI